jgi:UPF0755 protein
MRKIIIIVLAIVGILILLGAIAGFYVLYQIKTPVSKSEYAQEVVIEKGDSIKIIGRKLEKAELIRGSFYFEIYVWLKNEKNLQAGEYIFRPSMPISEIVESLAGGKINRDDIKITIPEGFSVKQIDERLAQAGLINLGEFYNFDVGPFVPPPPGGQEYHLPMSKEEGFLFPDTYFFKKDASVQDIFKKMNDNFNGKITNEMLSEINRQGKMLHDVIVVASIVQQESTSSEEMAKIAGAFYNRLNIGMALQSDATINYITGKGMRQPLLEDTKIDSPYNTYKYKGLPPTPICNPGIDAIKAAIWPEQHDYFYFLHPLNAPTIFSKTLEEHNINKAKWLK